MYIMMRRIYDDMCTESVVVLSDVRVYYEVLGEGSELHPSSISISGTAIIFVLHLVRNLDSTLAHHCFRSPEHGVLLVLLDKLRFRMYNLVQCVEIRHRWTRCKLHSYILYGTPARVSYHLSGIVETFHRT